MKNQQTFYRKFFKRVIGCKKHIACYSCMIRLFSPPDIVFKLPENFHELSVGVSGLRAFITGLYQQ